MGAQPRPLRRAAAPRHAADQGYLAASGAYYTWDDGGTRWLGRLLDRVVTLFFVQDPAGPGSPSAVATAARAMAAVHPFGWAVLASLVVAAASTVVVLGVAAVRRGRAVLPLDRRMPVTV